jgi:hypothetical protein
VLSYDAASVVAFTGTETSTPTEAFYGTLLHELSH